MDSIMAQMMLADMGVIVGTKIAMATYVVTALNSKTNIAHNLDYNSSADNLLVFYSGLLLEKNINYSENVNGKSVDLGWSLNVGEKVYFELHKNVK